MLLICLAILAGKQRGKMKIQTKTPHHIALFVRNNTSQSIFTQQVQQMDLFELCFRFRKVLAKDKAIMNEVEQMYKEWFGA